MSASHGDHVRIPDSCGSAGMSGTTGSERAKKTGAITAPVVNAGLN